MLIQGQVVDILLAEFLILLQFLYSSLLRAQAVSLILKSPHTVCICEATCNLMLTKPPVRRKWYRAAASRSTINRQCARLVEKAVADSILKNVSFAASASAGTPCCRRLGAGELTVGACQDCTTLNGAARWAGGPLPGRPHRRK